MTVTITIFIGYIINETINALQINKITSCSSGLIAALLSSTTNKIIRQADKSSKMETHNADDVDLQEIRVRKNPTSKIPVPKPLFDGSITF